MPRRHRPLYFLFCCRYCRLHPFVLIVGVSGLVAVFYFSTEKIEPIAALAIRKPRFRVYSDVSLILRLVSLLSRLNANFVDALEGVLVSHANAALVEPHV